MRARTSPARSSGRPAGAGPAARRTTAPAGLVRAALLILSLVLLSVAAPAVAGCGGSGEQVDPQAVLAASSAAMKEIDGFHFVYEVHQPSGVKPGMGLEIARITGDVNRDGDMQATIDVTQAGIPLSLAFVAVGDTHYIQDPLSRQWQSIPAASSPVGTLSLSAGTIRILDRIAGATFEGEESKGGAKTYHISGKVAAAEVEAIAGAVDTYDEFPTDIWVGIEDAYVYQVDIHGAATPNEDPRIRRSIVLSEHDVYVEIKPPL